MPLLIIKLFCFLAQLNQKEMAEKKIEQLNPKLYKQMQEANQ